MADKYRYVSVCERKKPIQTNSKQAFMMHVISCPACQAKLPASIIKQLEPKLSEIMAERGKSTKPTPSAQKITAEKLKQGMEEDIEVKEEVKALSPEEVAKREQEDKKAKLDALIKNSPSFQGLEKSVEGIKGNVARLIEGLMGGGGSTAEAPPTGEEPSGKTLTPEQEKLHEEGEDLARGATGQRPSPFGEADVIPAANRPGYEVGKTPPADTPPKDKPPGEGEKPPAKERAPSGGKRDDLPGLKGSEEIEYVEAWLAEQKRKQGVGAEEKPKKKSVIPYISDIKDVIREGKELVQEFRGGKEVPSSEESKGKTFRDFADQLASKILERSVENLAGTPGQTIGMDQMNTVIRLLGTFFTGVRALPKPMAEEMIRRIMEAGAIPTAPSVPPPEGSLPGGGLTSEVVS